MEENRTGGILSFTRDKGGDEGIVKANMTLVGKVVKEIVWRLTINLFKFSSPNPSQWNYSMMIFFVVDIFFV